jgi:asparagine synthase (glutamine-hydrolysing)
VCGIAAIFGTASGRGGDAWDGRARAAALERLSARGPDGQGEWVCDTTDAAWMGHRRLAIVDLSSGGAQPMATSDGAVAITYNGEVYNAPSLRRDLESRGVIFRSRSDTEVLLHGYRAWGIDGLLERVYGMYAMAIWDAAARTVHAAVDHAGMKPLYYAVRAGRLLVASTADAVRALGGGDGGVDRRALAHVLCHGYVPAPMSAWKGVSKLGAGTALRWRVGDPSPAVWRHWDVPAESSGASAEEFGTLWERVVGEHFESDVPVGVLLSGGIDSSAVAVAAVRRGLRPACVTLGLNGAHDESAAAGETARHLGLSHVSAPLGASDVVSLIRRVASIFDEPQTFGALLTITAISPVARQHSKVFLAGDGGDEAFAGYMWHHPPLTARAVPSADERAAAARAVALAETAGSKRAAALEVLTATSPLHAYAQRVHPLFHPAEAAALLDVAYGDDDYLEHYRAASRPGLAWPRRAQAIDLACFCAGSILPKVDRAGMACGLEVRAPFLDRRVLEWAITRPVDADEKAGGPGKGVLRRYLTPHVPAGVLTRPKQGFSLRTDWSSSEAEVRRMIAESAAVRSGLIRADWERFATVDSPYASRRAFALAMVAQWFEGRAA